MIPTWADLANIGILLMVWAAGLMCGYFVWGKRNGI